MVLLNIPFQISPTVKKLARFVTHFHKFFVIYAKKWETINKLYLCESVQGTTQKSNIDYSMQILS